MKYLGGLIAFVFLLVSPWSQASGDKDAAIRNFFERLDRNPKLAISAPPERHGDPNPLAPKVKTRPQNLSVFRSFGETDPKNKVIRFYPENDFASDFETLFAEEYRKSVLELDIWSGDYWPTYKMGLAQRYTDEAYPNETSYDAYIDYFKSLGPVDFENPEELAKLSPAEKYDLLVMDSRMNLTNWSLLTSESAYTEEDGIETAMTWAGICHGWAPAAYSVPRPLHSVHINLGFGELEFRPDDIKALATLLWARAPVPTRFLGGRCNTKDPDVDEFGRIKDPECFDINPKSWHTVLVNQMGIRKQSFVLDATYDLEVWNQPMKSYELTYFNPQTRASTENIEEALIPIEEFDKDTFKAYRSKEVAYVIGVLMDIRYLVETSPSRRDSDSSEHDSHQSVRYFYDIELDSERNLIGGEWYHAAHPDFIWSPMENAKAESWFDKQITETWDENSDLPPESWSALARQSSRQGVPLGHIVEELVRRSRLPQSPIEKE